MSFAKAGDLLRLAEMATVRYCGVALSDIDAEFGVDRRTAQRMTKALETVFPGCTTRTDEERRKLWKLSSNDARLMLAQGSVTANWWPSAWPSPRARRAACDERMPVWAGVVAITSPIGYTRAVSVTLTAPVSLVAESV